MPIEQFGAAPRDGPLGPLWELFFPTRCLGCGRRGVLLCSTCGPMLPWLTIAVCPRCAKQSISGRLCGRCSLPYLASIRAACTFDGVIRTAIHRFKFRHTRYLAPFLAQVMAQSLARRPIQADLLVPVPMSPSRRRERGYNHSELLAAALARLTTLPEPSPELLAKSKETRPQVGLSAVERRKNLRGAFACPSPELLAGRRCLLIDDVITTGATLNACAQPLIEAGAKRVMGLVVAREF
jgi:ComF family protein